MSHPCIHISSLHQPLHIRRRDTATDTTYPKLSKQLNPAIRMDVFNSGALLHTTLSSPVPRSGVTQEGAFCPGDLCLGVVKAMSLGVCSTFSGQNTQTVWSKRSHSNTRLHALITIQLLRMLTKIFMST
jgi:hypothetical protein